jgi:hypothetical protein
LACRKATNKKQKSTAERIPVVTRWLVKFWLLFRTVTTLMLGSAVAKTNQFDPAWGWYRPDEIYNADQVPGPFEQEKDDTWDEEGAERVWARAGSPDAGV